MLSLSSIKTSYTRLDNIQLRWKSLNITGLHTYSYVCIILGSSNMSLC